MIGHCDRRSVADLQIFGRNFDPALPKAADLLVQVLDVDDHAEPEHIDDVSAENARGKQIQDKLPLFVDDCVPGIVAALIAADNIVIGGQKIDHAAFALISPIDSADGSKHTLSSLSGRLYDLTVRFIIAIYASDCQASACIFRAKLFA